MLWRPSTIIRRLSRLVSDVVYATLTQRCCYNFCSIDVVCRPRKMQELDDGLGSTTRRYFVAELEIRLRQLRRRKEPKFFASRFFVSLIFFNYPLQQRMPSPLCLSCGQALLGVWLPSP
ncbi:hypothetical protein CY34DRAFT_168889 [Suillus luteus UH-Slu-Lm8-n1]|uniref:Uncharacterized protein n=1 Tax=Suillus luteus UH-Slu-Lm8-n1 TaxID=930992 RepID=A0A0D0BDC5_9AGAM|nr:hypothetical protein CY34DRAFT_168889 [Suillus luteus UH-Slu-Lm8-n1]